MTLPTFVIVGAMKTGTTSLYHYLRAHPDVFMPRVKELDFFIEEGNWHRGLRWYERRFAHAGDAIAIGEASTNYTKHPQYTGVPERIASVMPGVRIVYVVRDPIERIVSHYRHRFAAGSERRSLTDAVMEDRTYVDTSRYAMQLNRYLRCFPRDHIHVASSEGLKRNRAAELKAIYEFIGVDPGFTAPVHEREFYRTAARSTHSTVAWRMRTAIKRRFPAMKEAKELMDGLWGSPARRERSGHTQRIEVPEHLREMLSAILADDVAQLRAMTGDIASVWSTYNADPERSRHG